MARKAATGRTDLGRRPTADAASPAVAADTGGSSALEGGLLIVLALDAILSLVMLYIHAQLHATGGNYTSFCNVNNQVNCDAVLASRYGTLFGVPVAALALVTYTVFALVVLARSRAVPPRRDQLTLAIAGLAAWNLVFSVYMGAVAIYAVGAVCLLCAGMYVLNTLLAVLAWQLVRREPRAAAALTPRRATAAGGAIVAALAVVAAVQLGGGIASGAALTPRDVQARDPEFYRWYTTRPKVESLPPPAHVKGADDAPVTIVEFSDFECGYCAKAFRDLQEIERQYGKNVRVVFHHFPLDSDCNPNLTTRMHKSACLAAIAAECAARVGKFWEFHDRLFGNQEQLERAQLVDTAVSLGVDRAAFSSCLDDPAARSLVTADATAGGKLGVKSTPTLFINGREVEGALDRAAYEYVIAMERRG